jgi:hypothetical protein
MMKGAETKLEGRTLIVRIPHPFPSARRTQALRGSRWR